MQTIPELPPDVKLEDVEFIPSPDAVEGIEPPIVARNKKTGEIYR